MVDESPHKDSSTLCGTQLAALPAKLPALHILKQYKDATEQSSHHASTPPRPIIHPPPSPPFLLISKQSTVKRREAGLTRARERVLRFETRRKALAPRQSHSLHACFMTYV